MLRRLGSLLLSLALLSPLAGTMFAPPAAAYTNCADAGASNQVFVRKNYAQSPDSYHFFNFVSGDATVRDLRACSLPGGGTFVMAANAESNSGLGGPQIVQIGYGKDAGPLEGLHFVWADQNGARQWWPSDDTFRPVIGHRYRFSLTKYSSGGGVYGTKYSVTDLSSGAYSYFYVAGDWPITVTDAWWGYESVDDDSDLGHNNSNGYIDLAYMRYKFDTDSTLWTRDGWTLACCLETRGSLRSDIWWQGGNWDSSLPDDDMLDVWTNRN